MGGSNDCNCLSGHGFHNGVETAYCFYTDGCHPNCATCGGFF